MKQGVHIDNMRYVEDFESGSGGYDTLDFAMDDGKVFITSHSSKDGTYSERWTTRTIDLSENGYCFDTRFIGGNYEKIKKFYSMNQLSTFEDFSVWIQSVTVKKEAE